MYDDGGSGTATSVTIQADTSGSSAVGYIKPGDILMNNDELMWVLSVDGEVLIVDRAYAGTSADALADNDPIYIIGNAMLEGSSPGRSRSIAVTTPYNTTTIFSEDVEITGSETQYDLYGPDGGQLLQMRLDKRMRELYQKMERWLLYSQRYEPTTNTTARLSGGIAYYLANTTGSKVSVSGALAESDLIDEMETIFNESGAQYVPDLVVGNSWPKRKWTAWYRGLITTERAERVGGAKITTIETDFGTISYMLDHLVISDDLFMLNTQFIKTTALGNRTLKEFDATIPGKDHLARRLLGEYGIVVKNPQTMRWLTGFSTTA